MEKKSEIKKKLNTITASDKDIFKTIIERVKKFTDSSEITEESVVELTSCIRELETVRDKYYRNLINWLKQGYEID